MASIIETKIDNKAVPRIAFSIKPLRFLPIETAKS